MNSKFLTAGTVAVTVLVPAVSFLFAYMSSVTPLVQREASAPINMTRELIRTDMQPLPDLEDGVTVLQRFTLEGFVYAPEPEIGPFARTFDRTSGTPSDSRIVCLDLLFGTHNRTNVGTVDITFSVGPISETRSLAASEARDNNPNSHNYTRVCFPGITEAAVLDASAADLYLSSTGAPPGRSVTLWTAQDRTGGAGTDSQIFSGGASIEGRSIILRIVSQEQSWSPRQIFLYLSLALFAMIGITIILYVSVPPRDAWPTNLSNRSSMPAKS